MKQTNQAITSNSSLSAVGEAIKGKAELPSPLGIFILGESCDFSNTKSVHRKIYFFCLLCLPAGVSVNFFRSGELLF